MQSRNNNPQIINNRGMLNQSYDNNQVSNPQLNVVTNLNHSFADPYTNSVPHLPTTTVNNNYSPLMPTASNRSGTVGRKNYRSKVTQLSVFPMYGLWNDSSLFKSTKQLDSSYQAKLMNERHQEDSQIKKELNVDRGHFRKVYFEKTYMEELLKMKNMMGKVKK